MNLHFRNHSFCRCFFSEFIFLSLLYLLIFPFSSHAENYAAQFVSQSPQGLNLPYYTNRTTTFSLSYKNTGTVYWNNSRNVSDSHGIELRSVESADTTTLVNSPVYPGADAAPLWVNRQRVVGPGQERVDPGQTGDFSFTVRMPAVPGHYKVFFRPCIYGNYIGSTRYFDLEVTAPAIDAPENLTALADGLKVTLSWSDVDGEDGYQVERKLGQNGTWTTLKTLDPNITTWVDNNVSGDSRYYYRIRAYAGAQSSDWSNEYYVITLDMPLFFSSTVESTSNIRLTWLDASTDETGFKVYRSDNASGSWTEIADLAAGSSSYTDSGLTPDHTYYYGVRAYVNSTLTTPHFSSMVTTSATTGTENVNAPSTLTALADGLQVTLTWQDNSDNEDGFEIYRMVGPNGAFTSLTRVGPDITGYADASVSANWKYTYRVRACKGSVVSQWSNDYYAQVLSAPGDFSASVKSQTEIDLAWTDTSLGKTGFKLFRKKNPDDDWTEIADIASSTGAYTYDDKWLDFDTTYYYSVRAYADSTTATPHFSSAAQLSASTLGLAQNPTWVKTYRLVRAQNGRQDHLYTTSIEEKEAAEAAGYMFDGEDFMISSAPFVGSLEVVRLRKTGPGYNIRLYTTSQEEIASAISNGYVREKSLGYISKDARIGTVEVRRCYHAGLTDRFYTAYQDDYNNAVAAGYNPEHPLGYAPEGAGHAPVMPAAVSPASSPCVAIPPTLVASAFNDPDPGDTHTGTDWEVTRVQGDYSSQNLIVSRVNDPYNLTTIIPDANMLQKGTRYWWHVRYRDSRGLVSSWSQEASFITRCYDPVPRHLDVDGPALTQFNCKGHFQKFEFQVEAGRKYVITLTPISGDPDLFASSRQSDLDGLPTSTSGLFSSRNPSGQAERIIVRPTGSGTYYAAGLGATECRYSIRVSTPAVAVIHANRRAVATGGTIRFSAAGSLPSGAGDSITSYHWNFSDGYSASGYEVEHPFSYTGATQYVTLTITDNAGNTGQASVSVNVTGTTQGTTANQSGHSSDPVNMATGNYTYTHTDLVVPGRGIPFVFTRSYNSIDPYFQTGRPMGHGWTHTYNMKIIGDPDSLVTVLFPDGHGEIYTAGENGSYTPEPGVHNRLTRSSNPVQYTLVTKNRIQYIFDENMRLDHIMDRNGNTIQCVYDGTGNLAQVVDTVGRVFTFAYDPAGRLTSLTDPAGRVFSYTYAGAADLTAFTDPEGNIIGYGYDDQHQLTTVTDPKGVIEVHMVYDSDNRVVSSQADVYGNTFLFSYDFETGLTTQTDPMGNQTVYAHDDRMRLVCVKHPNGYSEYFEYDEDGNRISVTDRRGNATTYAYDGNGNVTGRTDPAGHTTAIVYNGDNQPVQRTDPLGRTTTYAYDEKGNFTSISDPAGNETTLACDEHGLLVSRTDANGHTVYYSYDMDANLVEITGPTGSRTLFTYDAVGRKISSTDAAGNTTVFAYDGDNRIVSMTDPLGAEIQFAYDAAGNRISLTDPLGRVTRHEYDLKNRPARSIDPDGGVTSYVYNAVDQPIRTTQPLNNAWTTTYNKAGKPAVQKDPLGNEMHMAFDPNGNLVMQTDPEGNMSTFAYDEANRLTVSRDPLENSQTIEYDAAGQVVRKIGAMGRFICFAYDLCGRLVSVTDPEGGQTLYDYDPVGNLVSITKPSGAVTTMEYDPANHLIRRTDPRGLVESFSYDVTGRLISKTRPDGSVVSYEYDAAGRLIRVLYPDGNEVEYEYDGAGNRTSMRDGTATAVWEYDDDNRIVSYEYNGATVKYAYDLNGNRTSITYPGGKVVSYDYDPCNRLSAVTDWLGQTTKYTYDSRGLLVQTDLPDGSIVRYSYDAAGRLISMENILPGGGILSSHLLTLDNNGNIIAENGVSPIDGSEGQTEKDYLYDAAGRLISAGDTDFEYDPRGNLIRETEGDKVTAYTFDAVDRLTAIDRNGDETAFQYDGTGNRISRTEKGVITRYIWDVNTSLPRVIAETDAAGNITKYHVYGLGLVETITPSGETAVYHFDARGNTIAVTDMTGAVIAKYAYNDFGKVTNHEGEYDTPFRFLGRYGVQAEGSLYYIRARYYDPGTGRFISQDPLTGNKSDPQALNRYIYALNNPIRFIDVSGFSASNSTKELDDKRGSTDTSHDWLINIDTNTAGSTPAILPESHNESHNIEFIWLDIKDEFPSTVGWAVAEQGSILLGPHAYAVVHTAALFYALLRPRPVGEDTEPNK